MVTFKNYNLDIIRDFSNEQFLSHIKLIENIRSENDFGNFGLEILLDNYLKLVHNCKKEFENGKEEFRFSANEVFLYDMIIEITRLCYKHSCTTSADSNDWEEEF